MPTLLSVFKATCNKCGGTRAVIHTSWVGDGDRLENPRCPHCGRWWVGYTFQGTVDPDGTMMLWDEEMRREMMKKVTAEDAVALLNEAVKLDPEAMHALVASRVPCNDEFADHPTIQVLDLDRKGNKPVVGLLGILNGLFGIRENGQGYLAASVDDDGKLTGFMLTPE